MPTDGSFLQGIKLFSKLDEEERNVLAGAVTNQAVKAGETLFSAGEPGDSMFIVRAGAIELFVKDTAGQKILLHTARPGDFFGELSLFDGGPRTATAAAVESADLVVLDREDLLQLFQKRPDAALDMLATTGAMTRKANAMLKQRVVKNVNEEVEERTTLIVKIADAIAAYCGSINFLLFHVLWFVFWIGTNMISGNGFDPFPFGLLTMVVSLEAIFLSCFVLISQNRQAAKDKVRADIEYEVNIRAELEVAHLHEKLDRFYEDTLARFSRLERTFGPRVPSSTDSAKNARG
jgi:uncharacterized membrane protein